MLIIGLCGGSGSGKSTVSRIFAEHGYSVFDSDRVYHDMISVPCDCTREISDALGRDILLPDGSIHRQALAQRVFAPTDDGRKAKAVLNRIAHRHVLAAFREWVNCQVSEKLLLDAPLLFEAGMDTLCTATVAVTAPREVRIRRIIARDGVSPGEAERRINAQIEDDILTARCDYAIENRGTLTELCRKTVDTINKIDERYINHE